MLSLLEIVFLKMADNIITLEEVGRHKDSRSGVWITIHGHVYNVTKFLEEVSDENVYP